MAQKSNSNCPESVTIPSSSDISTQQEFKKKYGKCTIEQLTKLMADLSKRQNYAPKPMSSHAALLHQLWDVAISKLSVEMFDIFGFDPDETFSDDEESKYEGVKGWKLHAPKQNFKTMEDSEQNDKNFKSAFKHWEKRVKEAGLTTPKYRMFNL